MCIMGNGNDPPAYHPGNFLMKNMNPTNVTGFWKTDHIVTIDIARNTDLKY